MNELTDDDIAAAKARDARFQEVDLRFALEAEMRDSIAYRLLMAHLEADVTAACKEFADANPTDLPAIIALQLRVKLWATAHRVIDRAIAAGTSAQADLEHEDHMDG